MLFSNLQIALFLQCDYQNTINKSRTQTICSICHRAKMSQHDPDNFVYPFKISSPSSAKTDVRVPVVEKLAKDGLGTLFNTWLSFLEETVTPIMGKWYVNVLC